LVVLPLADSNREWHHWHERLSALQVVNESEQNIYMGRSLKERMKEEGKELKKELSVHEQGQLFNGHYDKFT